MGSRLDLIRIKITSDSASLVLLFVAEARRILLVSVCSRGLDEAFLQVLLQEGGVAVELVAAGAGHDCVRVVSLGLVLVQEVRLEGDATAEPVVPKVELEQEVFDVVSSACL